jgi:hypothetical protein
VSRLWRGNTNGDGAITFAAGAVATFDGGPVTIAWIWRPTNLHAGGVLRAKDSGGNTSFSINEYLDGRIYYTGNGFHGAQTYTATEGWRMDAISHADGGLPIIGHQYVYTVGTWSHIDYGSLGDASFLASGSLDVGAYTGIEVMQGEIAVMGIWGTALTNLQIEGLTTQLSAWMALSPAALWAFNQSDVATPVPDLTGQGANQLSRVGTVVSAAEPPGFSYSLGAAPTRFARFGGAWVPVTRQVRSGGAWQTV